MSVAEDLAATAMDDAADDIVTPLWTDARRELHARALIVARFAEVLSTAGTAEFAAATLVQIFQEARAMRVLVARAL